MADTIFTSKSLCKNTWLIQGDGCNSYLVVGDNRGVLIDTGFATENIQAYAQTLTNKPVDAAANTHGHFDHTGGNGWFERAYMTPKALEIAKTPYPSKEKFKYPTDYLVTLIGDNDKIDLGNRDLEVIEIPAHAPCSVAFLDRKVRILFTGDEVDDYVMLVWMQDEPQPTIAQYAANMEKLLQYRGEFDYICAGHSQVMGDPELIAEYLENARSILSGIEGQPIVLRDDGPDDFHLPQPEFKLESSCKRARIGYDSRYVQQK